MSLPSASPTAAQCTTQVSSASPTYTARADIVARWLTETDQRTSGAFVMNPTDKPQIVPYFANQAALGLVPYAQYRPHIRAYLDWYIAHLNRPDTFGQTGTIDDYAISNGQEVSLNDYDSADAYAGTFLILVGAWAKSGTPSDQQVALSYLQGHTADLQDIASAIISVQDYDGLTWAKSSYHIKYLLDNAEAYAGLHAFARLGPNLGLDAPTVQHLQERADAVQKGINKRLWNDAAGTYASNLNELGQQSIANLAVWYPDAIGQLGLAINGVTTRAPYQTLYARFQAAQPGWYTLNAQGDFTRQGYTETPSFPFVFVGYSARLMGDEKAWIAFSDGVNTRYLTGANAYRWPWNAGDAGMYLLLNAPTVRTTPNSPCDDS